MRFLQNFWAGFYLNEFKCSCIALHLHFNYIFMHYRCVLCMLNTCVLVGLDWAEPKMSLLLHATCLCIFHAYIPSLIFILLLICVGAFLCACLSLSLSFLRSFALWHLNTNLLHSGTLFVPGHLLLLHLLTPLFLTYGSVMIKPVRTFRRTSHDKAFI